MASDSTFGEAYAKYVMFIRTSGGCIRGRRTTSVYGDPYYSFERIPYAEPPIGELRFKAPVPKKPWFITIDCGQKAMKPLQHNFRTATTEGSEDCLYLNIYVKQFKTETPLPIMVYIHGGGFERGDPTRDKHGPDYFMSKEVILVTIGYRLGALGFLSLSDPALDCPGNAGLKDQLLALKWLKVNAHQFNGDVNNITLFGCSAGAASAHFLSMAPNAKGLFHKMILQSGVAMCPWALATLPRLPHRLALALGYSGPATDAAVFEFLKKQPAKALVSEILLTKTEVMLGHVFTFGPVVEPYKTPHCIINYTPEIMITKAWGHEIPLLIGATSFEGLLMRKRILNQPNLLKSVTVDYKLLLPYMLRQRNSVKKQCELGKVLYETYFGTLEEKKEIDLVSFCEFSSYQQFWHPIHRALLSRQWYANAPTYVYRFDFDSDFYNLYRIKLCGSDMRGATHCDDLCYLFHSLESWKLEPFTDEFRTIQRMITIWTKFASTSNPNTKKMTRCLWPALDKDENGAIRCLNIGAKLKIMNLPETRKLRIWQALYQEHYDYDEEE